MRLVRLAPGERAPETVDRVHINALPNGRFGWSGSVAFRDAAVFANSKNDLESADAAEAEAIAWAEGDGATELYIERDDA